MIGRVCCNPHLTYCSLQDDYNDEKSRDGFKGEGMERGLEVSHNSIKREIITISSQTSQKGEKVNQCWRRLREKGG